MRVALISDIHGNRVALDAVLADARAAGAGAYWILGDLVAIGPEPVLVLERVASLAHATVIRGNTDRYVVTGDGPPPTLDMVRSKPELISTYAGIAASMAWTRGYITGAGWFDWVARLPLDIRVTTSDGVRILAVHASPGNDDGEGIHAGCSNARLSALIAGCDADVVFVAHTHETLIRRVDRTLVVNVGCVSNPRAPDLRASYVLLELSPAGTKLEHRRVAYDQRAFIESVHRSRHPAAEFILSYQRGEQPTRVPHPDHTPFVPGEKVRIGGITT